MTVSQKLLIDGEHTVTGTRTHIKALWWPFVVLLIMSALLGAGIGVIAGRQNPVLLWILVIAGAVVIIGWSVIPFLRWYTNTWTLTNKRLIEQKGILTRTGRIIPLSRINDVGFERQLSDRLLGCGTLIVHDASEQDGLLVHDIPRVEQFHRSITSMIDDRSREDR